MMFLITYFFFILVCQPCLSERYSVGVSYFANSYPKLAIHDRHTCSAYNAQYYQQSSNCSCGYNEILFHKYSTYGRNTPKCQDENYGNLYDCPCTDRTCSIILKKENVKLTSWKFSGRICPASSSSFYVKVWDTNGFQPLSHRDFKITSDTSTSYGDTIVKLYWKYPQPSYKPYEGRLVKFDISCNYGQHRQTDNICFVMRGIGVHVHTFDTPQPTPQPAPTPSPTPSSATMTQTPSIIWLAFYSIISSVYVHHFITL